MTLIDDIRSRGHWRVLIRPHPYVERRVGDLAELEKIVLEAQVRIRGWDYPHTRREGPARGEDWVGSEDAFAHHLDAWRLYQSGQFTHWRGMGDDWRDLAKGFWTPPADWKPGRDMGWGDAAYQFAEIYEFATRLAISPAGAERMTLQVEVKGLEGRTLVNDGGGVLVWNYRSEAASYTHREEVARQDLVARGRDLASAATRQLFARFGWDTSDQIVQAAIERR